MFKVQMRKKPANMKYFMYFINSAGIRGSWILTKVNQKPPIALPLVGRQGEYTRDVVVQERVLLLLTKQQYLNNL